MRLLAGRDKFRFGFDGRRRNVDAKIIEASDRNGREIQDPKTVAPLRRSRRESAASDSLQTPRRQRQVKSCLLF